MSADTQQAAVLPAPWDKFLDALDAQLEDPVELHCAGAFVLVVLYGTEVLTGDLDYIEAIPVSAVETLQSLAGPDTAIAQKYGVHLQFAPLGGIADVPENYASRLINLFPERFSKLRLRVLDPHDLALSKLTRNAARDERDFAFLAEKGVLDPALLKKRYLEELRPNLANEERHDLTLKLWIEAYLQR